MQVSLARCATVWLGVSATCLGIAWWAAGAVHTSTTFDAALPVGAALVLIACAAWAWGVTTVVVLALVRRRTPAPDRTSWAQRCVLAACGVALLSAAQVAPAGATPGHVVVGDDRSAPDVGIGALEGLALPSRTSGPLTAPPARTAHRSAAATPPTANGPTATVRPGDSLWVIAERLLTTATTPAEVAEVADLVHRLHALNRTEIGSDPDLIFPGHQLRTPPGARPAR